MVNFSRRTALAALPLAIAWPWTRALTGRPRPEEAASFPEFPAQRPDRVREIVGASHNNLERVRSLLAESPALAKATWDLGFGDWETALGAASHTGQREIALLLIEHGARADIFTFAMLGIVDAVRAAIEAQPGIQRTKGPHGLTLMHHARQGGTAAAGVVEYLEKVGMADERVTGLPLSDEEKGRFVGVYEMTAFSGIVLEVFVARNGMLSFRKGSDGGARSLYRTGEAEFHPVGAEAVRFRFTVSDGRSAALAIVDGPYEYGGTRRA
jgi:hypothetical protein